MPNGLLWPFSPLIHCRWGRRATVEYPPHPLLGMGTGDHEQVEQLLNRLVMLPIHCWGWGRVGPRGRPSPTALQPSL